ncbi:GMC oxidoreductase [Lactarius akahatsu]|uniref:GMC oxidoreductase n=1 Tax=Lactarius akahatsu TaxID=416441 RepID=A0AAD4QA44_9AGAM|nr:GMC oxidoreductase [Lactarius akahatsu]
MTSLKLPIPVSGAEALSSLASFVIDYVGGDSHLSRRVGLGAAVTLLALVLRVITSGRPKRSAIQRDPRKIGKVVGELDTEVDFDEYDIVIVGGGTAGCVLASRLSENRNLRVLLLEAGDSSLNVLYSKIPAGFSSILETSRVFNLYTMLQQNTGGRRHFWPRAKMLGGCEPNNSLFHYGNPSDYDEWARLGGEGADAWAYKDFHKYFLRFEKFVPNRSHPGVVEGEHGSNGPIEVGFHGYHSVFSTRFIAACGHVGIPSRADLNTHHGTCGVAKLMTYIDSRGSRVTTESAYLTPTVLSRPNLTVAVNASATRIIFDTTGPNPRAVGVEFASFRDGPRFYVRTKNEVLMLSGVGPEAHLAEHKIPVVASLPGVGEHLMDHPVVDVALAETSGNSLNFLKPRSVRHHFQRATAFLTYCLTGKGPLTTNVAEAAAFFRSDDPVLFAPHMAPLPTVEDSTSGSNSPDLELFVTPVGYTRSGNGLLPNIDSFGLHMTLLRPTSVGNLLLKSTDPFEHPSINPNYLSTEHDLAVLERGMAVVSRVIHTSPLADIIDHTAADKRLGNWLPEASPKEVRAYVRGNVETLYHPTSTARMAPQSEGGVVDARLRVHGIHGLRIVDASIFPTIISGHTAAPVIAVAEKAAELIVEDLALSGSVV